MLNIFSSNYLARKPIEEAMKNFSRNFSKGMKILDIGCGKRPYANFFSCKYIGLDPFKYTCPDVIANAWELPFIDNSFDGVILNQSLEHIEKTAETILEIRRVLKNDGIGIITVPQTMKNHSIPRPSSEIKLNNFDKKKILFWNNDFYRYTKFGLISLLKDFKIEKLEETNGYFSTIVQLINYFFASLNIKYIFIPIYLINNLLGLICDCFFLALSKTGVRIFKRFYELIYLSLTLNYIVVIRNKK